MLASFPKVLKTASKALKIRVFEYPTQLLSFDAPSPGNPREYQHKPYIARN